jgi:hypothetical protein
MEYRDTKSHFYVTVLGDSTLGSQQAEQSLRRASQQTAQKKDSTIADAVLSIKM